MNAKKIKQIKNNIACEIIKELEVYAQSDNTLFNYKLPREIIDYWIEYNNTGEKRYSGLNIQFFPNDAEEEDDLEKFKIDLYDFIENKKIVCSSKKLKKINIEPVSVKKTYVEVLPKKVDQVKAGFEKLQQLCLYYKKSKKKVEINKYDELCHLVSNVNINKTETFSINKRMQSDEIYDRKVSRKRSSKNSRKPLYINDSDGYSSDKSNDYIKSPFHKCTEIFNLIDVNANKFSMDKSSENIVTTIIYESDNSDKDISNTYELSSNSTITMSCSENDR